jgi:formylglycine-generating enzyme required for sulfatase activity
MRILNLSIIALFSSLVSSCFAQSAKPIENKGLSPENTSKKLVAPATNCPEIKAVGRTLKTGSVKCFDLADGIVIRMIWVEPGSFTMGSPEDEKGRTPEREEQKDVEITKGFWLAETEFLQPHWEKIMGKNPSKTKGADLPVEQVSYLGVQKFLEKINEKEGKFRLLNASEWEYACRAGTTGPYSGERDEMTWHIENSGRKSHPVATKKANPWGFYDMNGNILEWTSDIFMDSAGKPSRHPETGSIRRVQKGGQFTGRIKHTRAADVQRAAEEARDFYVGFRLARDAD